MKHERKIALIIFLLSLLGLTISVLAGPVEKNGKVISVIDGNTVEFLTTENEMYSLVLSGIDCPELSQEFGIEAKNQLEKLLKGKEATATIEKKDRFGNYVGSVRPIKGVDPRIPLLEKGLAWTQEKDPNQEFEIIKEEAKNKGMGLWKQQNPVAPWTFRRQQSMLTPKMG